MQKYNEGGRKDGKNVEINMKGEKISGKQKKKHKMERM